MSLPSAALAKFPAVAILAIESLCKESILAAAKRYQASKAVK